MSPRIRVDATLPTPIWSQIEESVRYLVASGSLRPGDVLPSVRDLAREQRINPNTVAKAYQRLVEAGILETRRGEGTFVADRPPAMPAAERARVLREGAPRFATLAVNLGAAQAEAVSSLQSAWPSGEATEKGVLITGVEPGSAAEDGGLRRGDLIKEMAETGADRG